MEIGGLDQPLEALEFHDDIVVQALKGDRSDCAYQMAFLRRNEIDILRTDDNIHRLIGRKAGIQTFESTSKETDMSFIDSMPMKALPVHP